MTGTDGSADGGFEAYGYGVELQGTCVGKREN